VRSKIVLGMFNGPTCYCGHGGLVLTFPTDHLLGQRERVLFLMTRLEVVGWMQALLGGMFGCRSQSALVSRSAEVEKSVLELIDEHADITKGRCC